MRCRNAKGLLALFLDGKLEGRRSQELKAHLDKCPACSKELGLLKETWNLLDELKPIAPSPNFKAEFWRRASKGEEAIAAERKPVFVLSGLRPRLVPVFAALTAIFIISIYLAHLSTVKDLQQLALMTKNEDIIMLKELDLAEDLEIIQNLRVLENLEAIDSIQL